MSSIVALNNLGPEFDIGVLQPNSIRLKIGNGLAISPDGTISVVLSTVTTNVTEVLRTIIDIGQSPNINLAGINNLPLGTISLDEIGVSIVGNEFTLPAGNYEFDVNFNLDSNAVRTNFNVHLREGTTILRTNYGHTYARNASGHDFTGQSSTMTLTTTGGTFNIGTEPEGNTGDVDLVGGEIIIRRYEQKLCLTI